MKFSVDDGSDQDYDSHIMVWQLPKVSELPLEKSGKLPKMAPLTKTDSNKTGGVDSRTSSSLDLGPTPGSGILTVDSDDDTETNSELPDSFGNQSEAPNDSYTNWNKDVESLLNNVDKAEEALADTESLMTNRSSIPSPHEDFTQQLKPGTLPRKSASKTGSEAKNIN